MFAAISRRGSVAARIFVTGIITSVVLAGAGAEPATAADPPTTPITWSTTSTQEVTVTVNETASYDGYDGTGTATSTKSATATGTATAATYWEVYYYAVQDAYNKAHDTAQAAADAEARPIAKQRAEDDARAKAAAGPVLITWSTTWTQEATSTADETASYDGYDGTGTATVTRSATATGTATATTNWEVYYQATLDAYKKATAAAQAAADADAHTLAKQRAEDDARAKAAAGPVLITWSTTWTQTETANVTETATVDGFEGYGTATSTKTVTATGTATAVTNWEVYYYAVQDAYNKAHDAAQAAADAEARPIAKQRAEADAQAQADAAAGTPDPGTDPGTGTGTGTTPSGPSCGNQVLKADGTPWTCTFDDEFRGTALDATKWSAIDTKTSQFSYGDCFLGLGHNIQVLDGALQLTTRKEAAPVTCDAPTGPLTTSYTSGAVTSLGKFSQTYGRVEIRAAMPVTDGPGLQSTLWLVPDDPNHYGGGWPHSGEIDVAEFYSQYADRIIPALHYNSALPWSDLTNNKCLVYKPTDFHTYGLEWTTTKLKISIDGTTCLDSTISPLAPLIGSAPFDRPFNLNLTQFLGSGDNAIPAGKDPQDATLKVDYVRVWS